MSMRRLINLVESPVDDALIAQVQAAAQKAFGYPLDGDGEIADHYGTTDFHAQVARMLGEVEALFAGGSAILHRIINLPEAAIAGLRPGASLGPQDRHKLASWTNDYTMLSFDGLHGGRDDKEVLFTALVPLSAVNLPATLAQRLGLHWENEISLNRGHPIRLLGIHAIHDAQSQPEHAYRPDLNGAEMKS